MRKQFRSILTIALVLALPVLGMAQTATVVSGEPTQGLFTYTITWDCGAGAAVIANKTFAVAEPCYMVSGWTNPGTEAPTDNYDITILNSDGADLFGAALENRDTTTSEIAVPASPGAGLAVGNVTFTLSNNSVNDAAGVVTLFCVTGD